MDYSNICFLFTVHQSTPHIIPDCTCMFFLPPVDQSAFTNFGRWTAFVGEWL